MLWFVKHLYGILFIHHNIMDVRKKKKEKKNRTTSLAHQLFHSIYHIQICHQMIALSMVKSIFSQISSLEILTFESSPRVRGTLAASLALG